MKKLPQLTHLIFSYYREDPQTLQALNTLKLCKLSRRWGTFVITCPTPEIYGTLLYVQATLRQPIAQLRLARKVRLELENYSKVKVFPIARDEELSWEREFKKVKLYR